MNEKIAVYPGTFDPITYGHLDIIERASKLFDKLIIAVVSSNIKNNIFSIEERLNLIQHDIKVHNYKNIEIHSFDGLLVDFVESKNAKIIIRGIRALSDFEYEFKMAYINHKMNHNIETIFLPATEKGHFIASSFVKEIASLDGELSSLVSNNVAIKLKEKYNKIKK